MEKEKKNPAEIAGGSSSSFLALLHLRRRQFVTEHNSSSASDGRYRRLENGAVGLRGGGVKP